MFIIKLDVDSPPLIANFPEYPDNVRFNNFCPITHLLTLFTANKRRCLSVPPWYQFYALIVPLVSILTPEMMDDSRPLHYIPLGEQLHNTYYYGIYRNLFLPRHLLYRKGESPEKIFHCLVFPWGFYHFQIIPSTGFSLLARVRR